MKITRIKNHAQSVGDLWQLPLPVKEYKGEDFSDLSKIPYQTGRHEQEFNTDKDDAISDKERSILRSQAQKIVQNIFTMIDPIVKQLADRDLSEFGYALEDLEDSDLFYYRDTLLEDIAGLINQYRHDNT